MVGYLCHNRHAEAERFLNDERARPGYGEQTKVWLKDQLYLVYESALSHRAKISLGQNESLFQAMENRFLDDLRQESSQERRSRMFHRLCDLYRTAFDLKLAGVSAACRAMILQKFPELLSAQQYQRTDLVRIAAEALEHIVGVKEALGFLLDEYDHAPALARRSRYDAWNTFHGHFASWRPRNQDEALLDRLLRVVQDRLTRQLAELQNPHDSEIYYKHNDRFWTEKEEAFAATAMSVFATRQPSPALARHVARYLADGLRRYAQAADLLLQAEKKNFLDEEGRYQLVGYLIELKRDSQAIDHLTRLIAQRPMIRYHLKLMGAYDRAGRQPELRQLLADIEKRFTTQGKWNIGNLERVAAVCVDTGLFADAVRLYGILIPQYLLETKDQGRNNETLSGYYQKQARAFSGLGDSVKAVESASAGIVLWGSAYKQRQDALNTLQDVLNRAKELSLVVHFLDEKAKKDGNEFPLIRRMAAQAMMNRSQFGLAVPQLRLVTELQPDDHQARELLIQAHDQLNQKAEAAQEAYALAEITRRNADYWADLGNRFQGLSQARQAERAFTSIVEMLPNEADGQIKLATVRQQQNQWPASITHWKLAVEYRAEDPSGLFGLAEAQIHEQLWSDAQATVKKLKQPVKPWHRRFGDLQQRIDSLKRQVDTKKADK
jgi:tetratricopeptide (TPR) repeat protein